MARYCLALWHSAPGSLIGPPHMVFFWTNKGWVTSSMVTFQSQKIHPDQLTTFQVESAATDVFEHITLDSP